MDQAIENLRAFIEDRAQTFSQRTPAALLSQVDEIETELANLRAVADAFGTYLSEGGSENFKAACIAYDTWRKPDGR